MAISIFTIIIALSMAIHVGTGIYVLIKCKSKKKVSFLALVLPGFLLLLGFMLEINSINTEGAFVARKVIHMGFAYSTSIILIFVADFCEIKLPKWFFYFLMITPLFLAVSVWTNDAHGLFYTSYYLNCDAFLPYLARTLGPIGVVNRVFTIGTLFGTIALLVYRYFNSSADARSRIFFLTLGVTFALISVAAYAFSLIEINLGVFATSIFAVLSAVGIIHTDMLDDFHLEKVNEGDFSSLLLDSSPMMIEIWDENKTLVGCNRHVLETFGINSTEEYTASVNLCTALIDDVFTKGFSQRQWTHPLPDGTRLTVEVYGVKLDYNERRYMVMYQQDLSEISEARQKERETLELYELILDSAPFVVGLWGDNPMVQTISKFAKELFGVDDPQDVARDLYSFSPKFQPCGTPTQELAEQWLAKAHATGYVNFEWMHHSPDGSELPVDVTYKVFDFKGKTQMVSFTRDLRQVKSANKNETAAFELTQAIVDSMPFLTTIWDKYNNLIRVSNNAFELFGLPDYVDIAEFTRRFFDYCPERQPCGTPSHKRAVEIFEETRTKGQFSHEWMHLRHDGSIMNCELLGRRVLIQNNELLIYCARDMTEVRNAIQREQETKMRAKVAEESNLSKSRFLARMSHELRTPITAVVGISDIQLKKQNLPPAIEESFSHINKSAQLLHSLINDLLDLSKIESGKMDLAHTKYETASLISDAVNMCQSFMESKKIKFRLSVDENLPMYLMGDSVRINQVMNNLLSNAFKYTQEGEVELSLSCRPMDGDSIYFVINVRDTGLGMTKTQSDIIFEEYSRFHEHKGYIQGAGLGMAIVSSLLSMMNAKIEIDSEENKGTTITTIIPQGLCSNEVIGKETASHMQDFHHNSRFAARKFDFVPESMPYGKVLIVDDIDANLYVSRGLMEFYDLTIDTSTSGFDALERVKQGKIYDIIFMDHMMPYMDGSETMRAIRELGYAHPIVVLTANALIGMAEAFMTEGFDGYLSKPLQTKQLDSILNKFIKEKQPPDVLKKAAAAPKSLTAQDLNNFQESPELIKKLRSGFASEMKNSVNDIRKAIGENDMKQAHLLAHSLKGRAYLIKETTLADLAESVEVLLKNGKTPSSQALSSLEYELQRVLVETKEAAPFDQIIKSSNSAALQELQDLIPMLEQRKTSAKKHLNALRGIPEAAILVKQVEKYDFASAQKSAKILQFILEEGGE